MSESSFYNITNPGSALGEAIGSAMESALQELLGQTVDIYGCYYLTAGVRKTKAGGRAKKLLLFDNFGNNYDIDGVITDEAMRPLILLESKYIRYKKHNRDKGSWVCHAHTAIRRRYHSIRSSIAILAGNWSESSVAMMESHDITLFVIPFDHICKLLDSHDIDFRWGEKEQKKAFAAWEKYNHLSADEKAQIGRDMIKVIQERLMSRVAQILDDTVERTIDKVVIELVSNLGEVKLFEFASVEEAIEFLEQEELENYFVADDSLTLFDPPPQYD